MSSQTNGAREARVLRRQLASHRDCAGDRASGQGGVGVEEVLALLTQAGFPLAWDSTPR